MSSDGSFNGMSLIGKVFAIMFWPTLIYAYLSWDKIYEYYLQIAVDPGLTEYSTQGDLMFCGDASLEKESPEQLMTRIRNQYDDPVQTASLFSQWKSQVEPNETLEKYRQVVRLWQPLFTEADLKVSIREELEFGYLKKEETPSYKSLQFRKANPLLDIEAIQLEIDRLDKQQDEPLIHVHKQHLSKLACITGQDSYSAALDDVEKVVSGFAPGRKSNKEVLGPILEGFSERFVSLYFSNTHQVIKSEYQGSWLVPRHETIVMTKEGGKASVECFASVSQFPRSVIGVGYVEKCTISDEGILPVNIRFKSESSNGILLDYYQDEREWDKVTQKVIANLKEQPIY